VHSVGPMALHDERLRVLYLVLAAGCSSPHESQTVSPVTGSNGSTLLAIDATSGAGLFYQTDLPLARAVTGESPYKDATDTDVLVACIGPSFMLHDCKALKSKVEGNAAAFPSRADPAIGEVTIVNCAVNGKGLPSWNDLASTTDTWDACESAVQARGYAGLGDVDVVLAAATLEPGTAFTETYPGVDTAYNALLDELDTFASTLATEVPNAHSIYWRSPHFQGFNNGEPEPYELGHALNTWLAANNDVNGTWNGWGVYAWSRPCAAPDDVENPDICYTLTDFKADRIHLVENKPARGAGKTAALWYARLMTTAWFP
jgi:hypothetical protein